MDPNSKSFSCLKLIDVDDPTKLVIPYDFATLLWGEQLPYGHCVMAFLKLLGKLVYKKMIICCSTLLDDLHGILMSLSHVFWKTFLSHPLELMMISLFWNVKMEALSDKCAFTDGWSKLIRDLALHTRSTFIFTMAGYKTFEVSVFNHETGTQIYFKKVEVVVLDDPIYGDDGFDLLLASEHKEKVITNESDVDQDPAGDVFGDSMLLSSSFDAYRSHVEPKRKSNGFVCDQNLYLHIVSHVRILFNICFQY
ncbi:putative transcription factor B3-Domain family [Helianthus anomalus]